MEKKKKKDSSLKIMLDRYAAKNGKKIINPKCSWVTPSFPISKEKYVVEMENKLQVKSLEKSEEFLKFENYNLSESTEKYQENSPIEKKATIRNQQLEKMLTKLKLKQKYIFTQEDESFSKKETRQIPMSFPICSNGLLSYLKSSKQEKYLFKDTMSEKSLFGSENPIHEMHWNNNLTEHSNKFDTSCNQMLTSEPASLVKSIEGKIKELKLKMLQEVKLDYAKLRSCPYLLRKIFEYLHGEDLVSVYTSCRVFNQGLKAYLKEMGKSAICQQFRDVYKNGLELIEAKIVVRMETKIKKGKTLVSYLLMQVRICLPQKLSEHSILIENISGTSNDKQLYRNIFKFDYKKSSTTNTTWILRELTNFHADELSKAYVMPINQVHLHDEIQLSVNLISSLGFTRFEDFKWQCLKSSKIPEIDFTHFNEEHRFKEISEFDLSRFCELEVIKVKWQDLSIRKETNPLLDVLIKKYSDALSLNFRIVKISWDDVGFLVIKIHTVASKEGYVPSTEIGIEIIIKGQCDAISNEIKKNGLIYDRSNCIQVRRGDTILFYLSLSKQKKKK